MDTSTLRRPLSLLASVLALTLSTLAAAEPPLRAARLGYFSGTVSFSPAGQPDWVRAAVNRPLTTGDRLWTGGNSRAELQIGGAAIRMGPSTSMTLLQLNDRIAQVQLSQGLLKVRVRSLGPRQSFEVATPNLAFTLRRRGEYRIEVDADEDATAVTVQSGEAEVYGEGASYSVNPRRGYRFYGTNLSDYEILTARRDDDLDRWSRERDRRGDSSVSARYVSSDVVGYEDLDANGTWRTDANYGYVWTPTRVASGWTPYRDGHWAWVDPWGWTWVDDAPWGYAVSHYGRWANINGSWGWVPGPRRERAVYAPALVAFVGGTNFQVSVVAGSAVAAAVGWFPLAPREVYRPSYPVSRAYFDHINRSNAVIAPQTITQVFNTTNVTTNTTFVNRTTNVTNVTNVIYANQRVAGAVVAVPTQAFVQSHSVAKATVQITREVAVSSPVAHVASVAPVQQSVQGGAVDASARPMARERAVVARTAPPPPPVPFAAQQQQLAAKPGKPIDDALRAQLKPADAAAVAAAAPKVSVVATAPAPPPTALPPATPPAARSPQERRAAAAQADAARGETRKPGEDKPAAARAEAARADAARVEAAKGDAARATSAKAEALRAEALKDEATKANAAKAASAKSEALRAEEVLANKVRADALKADAAKAATTKADTAKAEAAAAEAARVDAAKTAAAKAGAARTEAAKADGARIDAARAEAARANASKSAADKAEASRGDAARADAAKGEAAKAEAARADAARAAAAKADAAKVDASKAEAARANAARAAADKAEAARAEAAKAGAAKAEAAKAETARADAAKSAAAKAEAARAEAVKAEATRAAAVKAEAVRADSARAAPAKGPAAASAPRPRASGPKSESDAKADDEKRNPREEARKR